MCIEQRRRRVGAHLVADRDGHAVELGAVELADRLLGVVARRVLDEAVGPVSLSVQALAAGEREGTHPMVGSRRSTSAKPTLPPRRPKSLISYEGVEEGETRPATISDLVPRETKLARPERRVLPHEPPVTTSTRPRRRVRQFRANRNQATSP